MIPKPAPAAKEKQKMVPRTYVCLGLRRIDETQLALTLKELGKDGTLGEDKNFDAKRKHAVIRCGGVYEIESSEDGKSLLLSGAKYMGSYLDRAADRPAAQRLVTEWDALTEAAVIAVRMEKENAKLNGNGLQLYETLAPIRAAYMKTDTYGRKALVALVIRVIEGY
jgi:hypothetical protein